MRWLLPLVVISLAVLALVPGPVAADRERAVAVRRGLAFIYSSATVPANFADYGHDYLWCFCEIARTSADPELMRMASRLGRELALRWRKAHPQVDAAVGAMDLYELVSGAQSADCLGVLDESLKPAIREAAGRVKAEEMFRFDPAKEPPPRDIPKSCSKCGARSPRGSAKCRRCGAGLVMMDRYAVWCDALIVAFAGDRYGVRLGGSFADVVQWLPRMQPYPVPEDGNDSEFIYAAYAITHVVYAFNDYGRFRLRPDWLPNEFQFLKSHFAYHLAAQDPELAGEFMDTLKSFGLTRLDPLLASGTRFLMARQNRDGSWGDMNDPDVYNRYHSTWTAIDGLRDYSWQGEGVSIPAALARR